MEIKNAQEMLGGILSFQEVGGGLGARWDLVVTKESNFQSLEHLNHSYKPECHSQMLYVTPIQRPHVT